MSRNRRRHNHTNKVPIGAFSPWLIVALIFLCGGMMWVYFANNQVAVGREQSRLEKERDELRVSNQAIKARIHELRSFTAIQKRYSDGYIKLVPITAESVVQVDFSRSYQRIANNGTLNGEVRPVANKGGSR